jgi:NADPH:quinone reductase-like Zn-dependent oxidoreductase
MRAFLPLARTASMSVRKSSIHDETTGALSRRVRALAKKRGVRYEFLLMHASGEQLRKIAELVDTGAIRPVVGATFPFEQTVQALASLGKSSIRGKAVILGTNQVE